MERELPRLPGGPREDAQRNQGQCQAGERASRGLVQVLDVETLRAEDHVDAQNGDEEPEVPKPGDDERFLGRGRCGGPIVPEAYEQVGGETDQLPEDVEQYQVVGHDQPEHRAGEQGHVGEEPGYRGVVLHVAQRVQLDHEADARHDNEHDRRQGVHQDSHLDLQRSQVEPGVARVVLQVARRIDNRCQGPDGQREGCAYGQDRYISRRDGGRTEEGSYHEYDEKEGDEGKKEDQPACRFGDHLYLPENLVGDVLSALGNVDDEGDAFGP